MLLTWKDVRMQHCDDWLEATGPVGNFIRWARSPSHGMMQAKPWPQLYGTYKGHRMRVTMASRLGDVGITTDLKQDTGYQFRVGLDELDNLSETP